MKDSEFLYYTRPARRWTDALPLGNGSLGAMVFGTTDEEKLSLNSDTLWSGVPHYESNPTAKDAFNTVRKKVFEEGQLPSVNEQVRNEMLGYDSESYLPLGDLILRATRSLRSVEDYKRTLDLTTATQTISYKRNDDDYKETWFVSHPDNVLVGHIQCSEPVDLKITLHCDLEHSLRCRDGFLILDGQCPSGMIPRREGYLPYSDDPAKQGIHFRTAVQVQAKDGTVYYDAGMISLNEVTDAVLILATENSFNGFDKHPVLEGKPYLNVPLERIQKAMELPVESLLERHIKDYQALYNRIHLDFGSNHFENIPTNDRLNNFTQTKNDPALYTLLFNFGRFLAISASRPGSQAMNLQGIWNPYLLAPWASNYTVNINTEMNYWPMLMCNLTELNEPLVRMMEDISVAGQKVAKDFYGAEGCVCHHNSDIWRMCAPTTGNPSWAFWYNGAGWMSRHLFDQYEYTLDKDFLENTAYPVLVNCAKFYLSILTETPDGYLVCSPSTSPENLFVIDDECYAVSETTTMTMSICKEVLENTAKCCEILQKDSDLLETIRTVQKKLLPFKVGKDGRLLEWYKEQEEDDVNHRHVSHLYALHPANLISVSETPDLAEAARKTLETRGDEGTGWSLGWKINFWARLRDGNRALHLLDTQLRYVDDENPNYKRGGGTYANLFDAHPPFQIDGNFGAVSGITEMLLQSLDGRVYLLPALPDAISTGSVSGLRAKGNITVDLAWEDGRMKSVTLYGQNNHVVLCYNGIEKVVSVSDKITLDSTLSVIKK